MSEKLQLNAVSKASSFDKLNSTFIERLKLAAIDLFENPWTSAVIAVFIFLAIAFRDGVIFKATDNAYYNYLADAFLHGQTWLRLLPLSTHDLVVFGGKLYLYWAPFPAILLMPFVSIFGVNLNDVVYTALIASINVGLVGQLLRSACKAGFLHLSKLQRAILVFFFAFGTVHFKLATGGKVWATGQIIGFMCSLLAYLVIFSLHGKKAWFLSGLALAAAMITRTQIVFTGIFCLVYLISIEKPWKWKKILPEFLLAALPIILTAGFTLFYNQIRFGNPFDVGITYHNMDVFFRSDYEKYGFFNVHYIPTNLYYQYVFYPYPVRASSYMGGSLFLMSPLFLASFGSFWRKFPKNYLWALLGSILVTNIPILLCMGTGYMQFGPRYTLDFTVPLLLLTAIGMEKIYPKLSFLLALISAFTYFSFFM